MGKRKERRLAAMIAAGRRVKLDLFAEPSGEMVGTSLHDEVGGILDQDHRAGGPISPSSSGQTQENPLMLLGQYSDDELDKEANNQPEDDVDGSSSTDPDGQVHEPTNPGVEVGSKTVKDMTVADDKVELDEVDVAQTLESNDAKESDVTLDLPPCSKTADHSTEMFNPVPSEILGDGETLEGWKMVLHEQSNRYYYWNTVTGETSWEVPSVLTLDTQVAGEQNIISAIAESTSMHLNTDPVAYAYVATVDGIGVVNPVSKHATDYGSIENGEVAHLAYDANQSLIHYSTDMVGTLYQGYVASDQTKDALQEQRFVDPNESYEGIDAHPTRLVKYSEILLQRLKALERSGYHLEGYKWIMKEIEIRLSDCKALSSYGPSLLPFWWHTETQLKQLESAITKEEVSLLAHSKGGNEIENKTQKSCTPNELDLRNAAVESEVSQKGKNISFTGEDNIDSPSNGSSSGQIEASSQMPNGEDMKSKILSSGSIFRHLEGEQGQEVVLESSVNIIPDHLVPKVETHVEDVDMDVEMEVDEETPPGEDIPSNICPPFEQLIRPIPSSSDIPSNICPPFEPLIQPIPSSSDCPTAPLDDCSVPPPPDEEWIPPPPPDSELVPPPPPEDPPAPSPPTYAPPPEDPPAPSPPCAGTVLCPPYQDHYNMGYTIPTYEYYAPTVSEVGNGNYYANPEGSQTVEPQPPAYYEPVVANAFPEVPVDVNAVQPVAYYNVSSTIVPPEPVICSIESSGFCIESGPISYNVTVSASDQTASVGFLMGSSINSLSNPNLESSTSGVTREYETAGLQAYSISTVAQPAESFSVSRSAVDPLTSANQKNQPKVVRSKKRSLAVATLRSNKKVSSLVDKWKAAKEQLHGEEDEEPEDAYEILEKKRQKEIEKWRAKQIASGEAQENANFLPLGGDWRERVKRKKAAATTKAEAEDENLPDLLQLSKDLPSGWQVYWDESTKQVYYGNSITSETSWTRPTPTLH